MLPLSLERLESRVVPATVSWTGAAGNYDWDTAANWSTGVLPGASDDVVINQSGITISHSAGATDTINSLTSQANISISGGSLSLATTSTIASGLTISGGTLTGTGNLMVDGPLTWTGGTLSGSSSLTAASGVNISSGVILDGRTLDIPTGTTVTDTGSLSGSDGAVINNAGTWDLTGDSANLNYSGIGTLLTFNNSGSLLRGGSDPGVQAGITAVLNNTGSLEVQTGQLYIEGGSLACVSSGSFTSDPGTTLSFDGQYTTLAQGLTGDNVNFYFSHFGNYTVAGPYRANTSFIQGIVAFTGPVGDAQGNAGAWTIAGGNADFSPASGGPATLTFSSLSLAGTLSGTDSFIDSGAFTWTIGTLAGPQGSSLTADGGGVIGSGVTLSGRTLVIPAGITSSANPSFFGQAVTFTATTFGTLSLPGSVVFEDTTTGVNLGTVPLSSGSALVTTSSLAAGANTITADAQYSGGTTSGGAYTFPSSSGTLTQTVLPTILVLNPTASGALSLSGYASINIPGNLVVDSNANKALTESGNASIRAASIHVVGGVSSSGNATLSPAAVTGVAPVSDPLSYLTGPNPSGLTNYGAVSYTSGTHTLNPGIYSSIKASGTASLTLNPGVYIIEGGGVVVSGSASITGSGVTIYNTSSNYPSNTGSYGGITLSGNGTFLLTAPTSGTYAGIVIFQPYANTRAISLSGNAASGLTGTIYAPAALVYVSGNASVNGALVVNELSLSGNAASTQTAAGTNADNAGSTAGQLLEGDVNVYVNNSNGDLTTDELARIQDAVNAVAAVTAPYGVNVAEVTNPTQANVSLNMGTTSAAGNYGQGVLGCYTTAGVITLIQGWNWYAGADPTQIGSNQYDFETTVTHELGHALGLGESSDPTSAMSGTLAPATTIRTLTTADLNIPYAEAGADAQRAAMPTANAMVPSNSATSGPGITAASSTSVPSSDSASLGVGQMFAELTGLVSFARNAYQSELSLLSMLWRQADALALQRMDALLSMEAGAMGMSKDTLMRDFLFASLSAPLDL